MLVELKIPDDLYDFYRKIGQQNGGVSPEWTMADMLWQLAVEASENSLRESKKTKK